MACKQLTKEELYDLREQNPEATGFLDETDCIEHCGICCSNICSSCSINNNFGFRRCNSNNAEPNSSQCNQFGSGYPGSVWQYTRRLSMIGDTDDTIAGDGLAVENTSGYIQPPETSPATYGSADWYSYPNVRPQLSYVGGSRPPGSFWVLEDHTYREILRVSQSGFAVQYASYMTKRRLYQCQEGTAVDITDTAIANDPENYYVCDWVEGDPFLATVAYLGSVNIGTVLNSSITFDPGPENVPGAPNGYPHYTKCPGYEWTPDSYTGKEGQRVQEPTAGFSTRGNFDTDDLFAVLNPNDLLVCQQQECLDTITMTQCADNGGVWHSGQNCESFNCNA